MAPGRSACAKIRSGDDLANADETSGGWRPLLEDLDAVTDPRLLMAVDAPPFRGVGIRIYARDSVAEFGRGRPRSGASSAGRNVSQYAGIGYLQIGGDTEIRP